MYVNNSLYEPHAREVTTKAEQKVKQPACLYRQSMITVTSSTSFSVNIQQELV